MAITFDQEAGGLVVTPDDCPDCQNALYDTGCDAPNCQGRTCLNCGTGCDVETALSGESACEAATRAESDEDYLARTNAHRAAFGLAPVTLEQITEDRA